MDNYSFDKYKEEEQDASKDLDTLSLCNSVSMSVGLTSIDKRDWGNTWRTAKKLPLCKDGWWTSLSQLYATYWMHSDRKISATVSNKFWFIFTHSKVKWEKSTNLTPIPGERQLLSHPHKISWGHKNVSLCNKSLGTAKPRTAGYQWQFGHPNNYFNSSFPCDFYFILFGEDNIKYSTEIAELYLFSVTFLAL